MSESNSPTNGTFGGTITGTYVIAGGTTDVVTYDGATFGNTAVAVLVGPGTLASNGYASINQDGDNAQLQLTGGITWDNAGTVYDNGVVQFGTAAGDGATLVNEAGGTIDLTGGGDSDVLVGGAGAYALVNAGLLDQTGGGTVNIDVAVDDTGTIDAASGTITFNAGGTIAGLVEGNSAVNFDGGNVTLAATGDITATTVNFDPGTLYMQGGIITSPTLTIAAGDEVIGYGTIGNVQNNGTVIADGGVLDVIGNVTGSGLFESENGGVLEFNGTVAGTYNNTGVLELDNGATLTTIAGFVNTGDVYVNNTGSGGGALTVGGTLSNSNYIQIGNNSLATTVMAQGLADTGRIEIDGGSNSAEQATLNIAAAAPATWTSVVDVSGDALLEFGGTGGISMIASGAQINLFGTQALVAATGLGTTTDSALTGLTTNAGQLELEDGASLTTTGGLDNSGGIYVNNGGSGGSFLAIDGTLTSSNYVEVGNSALATTVTAQDLANTGRIDIDGGSSGAEQATLGIAAAAPATWTGVVNLSGDALLEFGGTAGISTIASGAQINLFGTQALVAASGVGTTTDSALTGLTTNAGQLQLQDGASLTTTGGLDNSGGIYVNNGGSGGSFLTIDGTLTNSNYVQVGNSALATTVTAQDLANTGRIDIDGGSSGAEQATLGIAAAAPATWMGVVYVSGDALLEFDGTGSIGTIASGAQINLYGTQAFVVASGLGTTNDSALTGLTANDGQLQLQDGVSLTIAGGLVNSGNLFVDAGGSGGSSLALGGTFTNSNYVEIGNNALATTLTAQGLANTGRIDIDGGGTVQATLGIAAAAPETWTGVVNIGGDGLLQFGGTSGIGTIASGAQISLLGQEAFIAASGLGTTSDNVLTDLAVDGGQLELRNGASLTIAGGLANSGNLNVDDAGNGGSSLTIGGTLTNSGHAQIGNGGLPAPVVVAVDGLINTGDLNVVGNYATATAGATLDVNAIAGFGTAGVLTGSVFIDGYGVIAFTGDQIGTIAKGASLELRGSGELADAGDLGSNSALSGLAENDGVLAVRYGNAISLTGNLLNAGDFYLQDQDNNTAVSVNSIAGTLTNSNAIDIGSLGLTAATTLSVGGLVNTGDVNVIGSDASAAQGATLDVNAIAGFGTTGVLTGSVYIDGYGVIAFASGQIGTIASGASLELRYLGELADAGNPGSNSALSGLAENDGVLAVRFGNTIGLTGNLLNTGNIYLQDQDNNALVSVNSIAGTLTNSNNVTIGNGNLTAPTTLTVGGLVNTGYLSVVGNFNTATQGATLDVNAVAGFGTTGVLTGSVYIDGYGVIAFSGGQIGTIASGASLELRYVGELADARDLGSNSALNGLAENDGVLAVRYGNAIGLTGNLLNTGDIYLQDQDNNATVSVNSIAGTLTNSHDVYIGNGGLTGPTTLTVGGLVNTDYLGIVGNSGTASDAATLTIDGPASSSATMSIGSNATVDVTGGNTYTQTGGNTEVSGVLIAGTIAVDGGELQLSGGILRGTSLTVGGGALLGYGIVQPTITSDGTIEASGGSLDLQGGLATPAALTIEGSSALELAGADSGTVAFAGPNGTFLLDDPVGFTGTIGGLAIDDTLVLNDTTATSAIPTYDAATNTSTLAISLAGGGTIDYTLAGDYAGVAFAVDQAGSNSEIAPAGAAVGTVVTATPIDFGVLRGGTSATKPLEITNNGPSGAAALDVTIGPLSGDAIASGTITALAPQATDSTDITVGINTGHAGVQAGAVTLDFASDLGSGNTTPLPGQTVAVSGTVYREAVASITPIDLFAHIGGAGVLTLDVANAAPADGFSESLIASLAGASGGLTVGGSGPTGDIAAGTSNTTALTLDFSTAQAGAISGGATIALTSDGGTGAGSIDGLGTIALPTQDLPFTVTVDNYATAAIEQAGSIGLLGQVGDIYTLDLGTFASGVGAVVDDLAVANSAAGPADVLTGTLSASGDAAISDIGLGSIGTLAAGGAVPFSVVLSTATAGVFNQAITLDATDSNAGGYSQALAGETIDVTGTVLSSTALAQAVINTATPIVLPDVHVTTGGTPTDLTDLSVSNQGSAVLSAAVAGFTGNAYGAGSFSQLAVGATDATDIAVGVDNTSAGAKSGVVTIDFQSGANLITDGDFDDVTHFVPPSNDTMVLPVGSTILPGWMVVGSEPLTWIGPTNPYGLGAESGGYFLDLTGNNTGAPFSGVSQTIATTAGDTYQLSFELGSSSIWGLPDGITASAAGTSETFTSTATGSNNWQSETLDFTAIGSTSTISLVGASGVNYIGLDNVSVTPDGTPPPVALNSQTVTVSGNVYRLASASISAPSDVYLHVGDDGGSVTEALTVKNTDPADGYSEGLEVTGLGGAGGAVTGASGSTGDIAAQGSDDTSLSVTFSTAAASLGGTVAVSETSDGSNIDSLGTTSLGTVDMPVGIDIDNFATAAVEQLGGDGTLTPTGVANTYTLDLGTADQYASPLSANLGALNAAQGPAADLLDGNFAISGDSEYANGGVGPFSGISFGNADTNPEISLNTGTIGTFTEQVVLNPTGTNASGYSGVLSSETVDVVGTIIAAPPPPPPPRPVAIAWGDVHLTTFDGLYYNFQAEGEFVLAQSTVAGDSFQVQARLQPWSANSTVSVMTMIGAEVGTDRVTFALDREDPVWVNGAPEAFAGDGSTIPLPGGGGSVTQVSATSYQLTWNTGEVMDVTDAGTYLNMNLSLSATDGAGSVQGLLGGDSGQANDFALPDGTVLAQPLSSATLYGEFADAWRVTDATSLMDYLTGETTATFTDDNFPADAIGLDSLPAAILAEAQQEVIQAGITNPNLQAAAIIDLLVTGDPNSLLNDLDINQTNETTNAAVINSPPPPIPALGVSAVATNVIENASGTTTVTFNAYLTSATGTDTVIDWAVTAPNATFLGASALGGTLPSGFVVVPAGQSSTQFTVTLPTAVLGSQPSSNLQVTISSTNGDPVFGQTAQTEIDNDQPVPGNPAIPQLTLLSGAGIFAGSDGTFTLNVGTLVAGESPLQDRFQLANVALAPSDLLGGTITVTGGSGFMVYGDAPLTPLAAGASYQGLVLQTDSSGIGAQSETIVISPVDENITGYSSILPSQTLTVTDTVVPDAVGDLLTGGPVNLGTFYQGGGTMVALAIMNAAAGGSAGLDVSTTASGEATAGGTITALAPGATNSSAITVEVDTNAPGVQTGIVTLNYVSDAGNGNIAADGSATIEVVGTVYGPATAAVSAEPVYVHQGDDGGSVTVPITVSNTAPNNGFAEDLIAQVTNFGTYVTAASGTVILAPQMTNDTSLTATLSDANLGTYAGEVELNLQSDGTGIDSAGTTELGVAFVQATVNVDQYAVAAMEQISGSGSMAPTGVAAHYVLDLGTVAQYATPLGANLGVLNDVVGTSDLLGGSFSVSGAPEFVNTGFTPFGSGTETAGLAAQQVDGDPVIVLSSGTVGVFTETVTLDPTGYNPSGYSAGLAPETVTVTGTVVAAPPPTPAARVSDAWGDVHLTTFDGLYYNFQAEGEFVLTESTIAGDTFQIQARMQPWSAGSSVSVNTEIAAEVGNDRVSFAIDRPDTVWIDGVAQSLSNPVVTLADGTLEQTSANSYELTWNTGEQLDITDNGTYLNASVALPNSDAGNVQGLLGNDDGNPNNDLALPGGAPITTDGTVTYAELYGQYANAWRITDATSLMDYGVGQDTASFTDVNFPYNQISLGNLPADAVAQALAAAEAAGITDPNLQQAAIEDYLFTGNPDALAGSANVQQQEGTTSSTGPILTAPPPVAANVGVESNVPTAIESTVHATAVGFTIYLTSPEANATTVDFAVTDPGPGFLTATDFGGILPSGAVTIAAGQTTALFTVELPASVLGSAADENLQVTISPQGGETVFAPLAQTEILNIGPTAGNPAQPVIEGVSGEGDLTGGGTSYVLNLGTVEQFANPLEAGYGVLNNGTVPADLLSGSFVVNGSSQFLNSGLAPFDPIGAGSADTAPVVEMLTNQVGSFTEDVVLSPTDSNATGYSAMLNNVTLEVTGTVIAPPPPPPPAVPLATAWGDVHITTFDGLYYNFQAAGEFVLTKSTIAGDTFQVQARLQPWTANSSVSVQTQVAAAIGTDDVTFGVGSTDAGIYLDGTPYTFGSNGVMTLSGGTVTEISADEYRVNWNTGETMTVTLNGSYISDTIALTAADAGNVQGLLGPDDGNPSSDLQLADGTIISQAGLTSTELYGPYANAWRVTQPTSLLTYSNGETTATFTDTSFPQDALDLNQLPAGVVAAAEQLVESEGITNPNLIQAAVIDLLVTGDPNAIVASANVQQEGVNLSGASVSNPPPLPNVGIVADNASALEPSTGTLAVPYTIYLTAAESQATTIDYAVTTPGAGYLGSTDIVGGTGSGSVQIAAGQTSAQITVDLLANALGSQPEANLQVTITPTGGEAVVGASAQTEIVNPAPTVGNPAMALIEQLGGDGALTGSGTNYALDLGTQVQNGPDLFANLGIENNATVPADDLSGQFSIGNFTNYVNSGFGPFSSVAPGTADTEPVVSLNTGTIGVYTEQVVLDPTDTNATGYSAAMNDVTLTVTGTIVPLPLPPPPPVPTATSWGDVHITTFDGLYYNFQAVGEFTLAKSTVANDDFDVQIRTTQWSPGATVSVIDQVAVGIDNGDRVTFGLTGADRSSIVEWNGSAYTFSGGNTLTLAGGTVTQESSSTYVVNWDTGESLTVTVGSSYINSTVALAAQDANGNVEGLLGYDTGVDTDFEPVVSGTTITTAQLYGGFADTWRLTQPESLLDYGTGQTTATFTDLAFPSDALSFADLPSALQQEGLQMAIQAGITDPQLQQAAALDFIVTGDPSIVTGGQNVQQQGISTTDSDVSGGTVTAALGVSANNAALVESSGDLSVGFTVNLTEAEAQATTVDYAVTAPDAAYLGASAFGGTLPSGSVTIAAGQTSATFSVTVPADVLGALPSSDLQVTITPTGGESVFAPSAQTTIVNNQVEAGTSAMPEFALLSGIGTLTQNGEAYTLNLGTLALGATVQSLSLAIENAAAVGSNDLAGTLTDPASPGFTVSGTGPLPEIAAGDSYQGLHVAVDTSAIGEYSETITFTPVDQNDSGYSAPLSVETLTVTADVPCFRSGTRILTACGEVAVEDVRIGDRVRTMLGNGFCEVIWVGRREVDCAGHAQPKKVWPVRVTAGAFGEGRPHSDVFLSPDHAVYVEEVLIPIKHLINGSTIAQVKVDRIVYHHIELAEHDVLLAEGLPAESFLDIKDGTNYANRAGPVRLYPDYSARMWEAFGCARLVVTGPELDAARAVVAGVAAERQAA